MQFNVPGILGIVNFGGTSTDNNDIFITTEAATWLNGGYTIFGTQTSGADIRSDIAGVAATYTSGTGTPKNPVTITSASVTSDPLDGVMLLNVEPWATGSATITVTATNAQNPSNTFTETFTATTGEPPVTVPTVTSVSSIVAANSSFTAGSVIPITVSFSEPVLVNGTPQLALNASPTAEASYVSGSGSDTLTFDYAVAAGDAAAPLDYTSIVALTLNGGADRRRGGRCGRGQPAGDRQRRIGNARSDGRHRQPERGGDPELVRAENRAGVDGRRAGATPVISISAPRPASAC